MRHAVRESASPDRFRSSLDYRWSWSSSLAPGESQPTQKRLLCSRGSGRGANMKRELPAAGRVVSLVAVCVDALNHHLSHMATAFVLPRAPRQVVLVLGERRHRNCCKRVSRKALVVVTITIRLHRLVMMVPEVRSACVRARASGYLHTAGRSRCATCCFRHIGTLVAFHDTWKPRDDAMPVFGPRCCPIVGLRFRVEAVPKMASETILANQFTIFGFQNRFIRDGLGIKNSDVPRILFVSSFSTTEVVSPQKWEE